MFPFPKPHRLLASSLFWVAIIMTLPSSVKILEPKPAWNATELAPREELAANGIIK
jgi:hypothetical protein